MPHKQQYIADINNIMDEKWGEIFAVAYEAWEDKKGKKTVWKPTRQDIIDMEPKDFRESKKKGTNRS